MINDIHTANGKNVTDVLHDFKNEFSTFVSTRVQMFQEEMRQKTTAIKSAMPTLVVGLLFLVTAWLLVTGAIVSAIFVLLAGNPWALAIAFGAVAVAYGLLGLILAMVAKSALSKQGLKPEKTIRVLQEDKLWLQTEATRVKA